jgi:hypothetical protein
MSLPIVHSARLAALKKRELMRQNQAIQKSLFGSFIGSALGTRLWELVDRVPKKQSSLSSHFSRTAITDTKSQSRNNSPTVQHQELRPSPETDPKSAAKPSLAAL